MSRNSKELGTSIREGERLPSPVYGSRELDALFSKFKNEYLPELKSLYEDCVWLKSKLGLSNKRNMLPNEVRLVQFTTLVDAVINQINKYKISSGIRDGGKMLKGLEVKIVQEILPVREKLRERLRDVREASGAPASKRQNIGNLQPPPVGAGSFVHQTVPTGGRRLPPGVSDGNNDLDSVVLGSGPSSSGAGLTGPAANKFPSVSSSSSGLATALALGADGLGPSDAVEDEYVSQRRRKRLSQIVPNPRKARVVDYICSLCNEQYQESVVENPWWAVRYQACKKCGQSQIPRIDILAEANAIEHDPNVQALYGEGLEDSGDEQILDGEAGEEGIYTYAEGEGAETGQRQEHFGTGVDGFLEREEASKLLVLMCHARTCTGVHQSAKHAEICKSTKFLMLHIRDCNGVDIHGRPCRFPWCMPCKRMLQHLTHCYDPTTCSVCNPWSLPDSFAQLRNLNQQLNPG